MLGPLLTGADVNLAEHNYLLIAEIEHSDWMQQLKSPVLKNGPPRLSICHQRAVHKRRGGPLDCFIFSIVCRMG